MQPQQLTSTPTSRRSFLGRLPVLGGAAYLGFSVGGKLRAESEVRLDGLGKAIVFAGVEGDTLFAIRGGGFTRAQAFALPNHYSVVREFGRGLMPLPVGNIRRWDVATAVLGPRTQPGQLWWTAGQRAPFFDGWISSPLIQPHRRLQVRWCPGEPNDFDGRSPEDFVVMMRYRGVFGAVDISAGAVGGAILWRAG